MKPQLIRLLRIVGGGFRNFFRNLWLSTAATAIMVVTLTILLSSFVINRVLDDTVADIAKNITVSVFLKDEVSDEDREQLSNDLERADNVDNVSYISKDEALKIFTERNQDSSILDGISVVDNVLPASFEVTLVDLTELDAVVSLTSQDKYADAVDDTSVNETRRKSIERIADAQDFIALTSLVNAGIFAGISVLVIFNTIRMAVFTRSDEIEIMKLIGATRGYIRGPFLAEAALYGLAAGFISFGTVYGTLLFVGPKLSSHLLADPTIDYMIDKGIIFFFATIGAGMMIGLVSSWLATNKYLRLKRW